MDTTHNATKYSQLLFLMYFLVGSLQTNITMYFLVGSLQTNITMYFLVGSLQTNITMYFLVGSLQTNITMDTNKYIFSSLTIVNTPEHVLVCVFSHNVSYDVTYISQECRTHTDCRFFSHTAEATHASVVYY